MNLNEMQDLLNALEVPFKVFLYVSTGEEIVLRVFYNHPLENPGFRDITYNMQGNYIKNT